MILGIDPGKSGGWFTVNPEGDILTGKIETDFEIVDGLGEVLKKYDPTVYIEKVGGFVKGNPAPGSAMFNFGQNVGFLRGVIMAHKCRVVEVTPAKWMAKMGAGKRGKRTITEWKNHLKSMAIKLQPKASIRNWNSDAVLIYEYGVGNEQI